MDILKFYDFSDKVIIVTGGTGVLLSPTVRALINLDAQVVLLSRTPDEALIWDKKHSGKQPMLLSVDVTDKMQLISARERVLEKFNHIDILINGAGGNDPAATTNANQRFFDLPQQAVEAVFDLNYLGTFLSCQVFGEQMAAQQSGVILNVSSMAGLKPLTRVVSYSGAKAAVDNLTRWLAVHMAHTYSEHIRVNAIAPGFLLTDQNRFLLIDSSGELTPRGDQIISATPMKRFGSPDEMIGTILWLISDAAKFVSGVVVPVDGGFSAYGGV